MHNNTETPDQAGAHNENQQENRVAKAALVYSVLWVVENPQGKYESVQTLTSAYSKLSMQHLNILLKEYDTNGEVNLAEFEEIFIKTVSTEDILRDDLQKTLRESEIIRNIFSKVVEDALKEFERQTYSDRLNICFEILLNTASQGVRSLLQGNDRHTSVIQEVERIITDNKQKVWFVKSYDAYHQTQFFHKYFFECLERDIGTNVERLDFWHDNWTLTESLDLSRFLQENSYSYTELLNFIDTNEALNTRFRGIMLRRAFSIILDDLREDVNQLNDKLRNFFRWQSN